MGASLITILAFLFLLQQGAEHPVPLPADINAAQCLECHTDKQQGKYVHTAVSMGCTACHQVETKNDTTKIGLIAPGGDLCLTCHEQTKEGTLHAPYEQKQCLTCHNPHSSDNPGHTRAPLNGLCLSCHGERAAQGENVELFDSQTIPAEALKQIPKIVLDRRQREGHPFMEHPVTDRPDPLRKGQQLSCLSCHMQHAAPLPKLLPEEWKEIAVCDKCHDAAKAEKLKEKEKP